MQPALHFNRHFEINVKGAVFTLQKVLPLLGEGASVIVNASIYGLKGQAGLGVYCAAKAEKSCSADLAFSEKLQNETAAFRSVDGVIDRSPLDAISCPSMSRSSTPAQPQERPSEVASASVVYGNAKVLKAMGNGFTCIDVIRSEEFCN